MIERPINKTDFPVYEGNKTFYELQEQYQVIDYVTRETARIDVDGVRYYHEDLPKTFVKILNQVKCEGYLKPKQFLYGYVLVRDNGAAAHLVRNAERLERQHHKFRRSPVQGTSKYRNSIDVKGSTGLKKEYTDHQVCDTVYKSFKGLTRIKRVKLTKEAMDWDFYNRYNDQRGWKRTKKAKQWM